MIYDLAEKCMLVKNFMGNRNIHAAPNISLISETKQNDIWSRQNG
jgi:hypothetical protein